MQTREDIIAKFDFNYLEEKIDAHQVQETDIIVGIPSYNEADNIAFVVEQVNKGLLKYFPQYRSVIVNVDNHSPDDTRSAFLNSVNHIPKIYVSTPGNIKGKGNNFYNLFFEAIRLKAKAVVVVDADLLSITPEWVLKLATPILSQNYDFVTPLYSRNEYDGTITNNICYPLLYGVLGKDIRQPIGGDFAFSSRMAAYYLARPWQETTRQYGIDIFMTLNALIGDFKVCQVALGAKIHKPSAPKLGPMFTQVVGTLFKTLLTCQPSWQNFSSVEKLPLFGEHHLAKPQSLSVDYKSLKQVAMNEFNLNRDILREALENNHFQKIRAMFDSGKIKMGSELWACVVYDVLHSYSRARNCADYVEALKPLYFGRVVSFIKETLDLGHEESEKMIQNQARLFFKKRNYLLRKFSN